MHRGLRAIKIYKYNQMFIGTVCLAPMLAPRKAATVLAVT
jgi:hypothetical protein